MISYGGIPLHLPGAQEAAWIASRISPSEAFGFFRAKSFGNQALNPRPLFNWFLSRPMKLNAFYNPWGASRWGYAFALADYKMLNAIGAKNSDGQALPFKIDDGVGSAITTNLHMLTPVPLSKINVIPSLPLFLLPLVDERQRLWERSAEIEIDEGSTTWTSLFTAIAAALNITLAVDPISTAYLKPSNGLTANCQHLPMLLDLAASSVGQRIVRTLNGQYFSRSASSAIALMASQANAYRKYAGGSLELGIVNA